MRGADAGRLMIPALLVGLVGLVALIALAVMSTREALASLLTATLFLLGLPVGAMTLLMIHLLTGGKWGDAVRAPLRAMTATLPLALILLLPVLAGAGLVFPWAGADPSSLPQVVRFKLAWLNLPFFTLRFVVCAVAWLALAWAVLGWTREPAARGRGAAIGLIVNALAVTFFTIDWMLSLEPAFYSTIYGMLEAAGGATGAYALALLIVTLARPIEATPGGSEGVALSEDAANMLFSFVLMWAYLAFMQWLIVWAADLPHEIHWYLLRVEGGWLYVLWLLIGLEFAVPFAGFLVRDLKRSRRGILALGAAVLAGHLVDVWWRVRPPLSDGVLGSIAFDLAALVGAGGLWLSLFLFVLTRPERLTYWRGRLRHG